jgi:hypothetical protein
MASVCETRSVTLQLQPGLRRYRVTYRVDMTSPTAGPIQVVQALGKQLFISTYSYGGIDADASAWLVEIGVPRRAGGDKLRDRWLVDCIYEFDQSQRPENGVSTVEPFYLTESEPIPRAKYLGAFQDTSGNLQPLPPGNQSFTVNSTYPISNSARVPILPTPERDNAKPAYRVSWTRLRADFPFSDYINKMNNTSVTLTAQQFLYTSGPGLLYTTFQKTFDAQTLRLRDVQVSPVVLYGRQWFEHTLEFVEDIAFVDELDRGLTARADDQDPDGRGGTISGSQTEPGQPAMRTILDADGNSISDPVLLDGRGQPRTGSEQQQPVYLRWQKYELADFNALPIGVI